MPSCHLPSCQSSVEFDKVTGYERTEVQRMMAQVESTRVEQLEQVESTQVDGTQVADCTNVALEQPLKVGAMEKWLREFSEGQHRTPYISRRSRPHPSSRSPTDFVREPFLYSSESEEEEGDEIIFASELIKISNEFKAIREENANLKSDNDKLKSSNAKFHADQQKRRRIEEKKRDEQNKKDDDEGKSHTIL